MSFPEYERSEPLEGVTVDSYDLLVRRAEGEALRPVAARAIAGANGGKPVIKLGKGLETEFVSGGGAVDLRTGRHLEIAPDNVALRPSGDKLRLFNLPDSDPFESPFQN